MSSDSIDHIFDTIFDYQWVTKWLKIGKLITQAFIYQSDTNKKTFKFFFRSQISDVFAVPVCETSQGSRLSAFCVFLC